MRIKKLVFIHIPKTGGKSVDAAIKQSDKPRSIEYVYLHGIGIFKDNIPSIKEGYAFAFVRNPWDRVVSNYYYAHKLYRELGKKKDTPLHNFRIKVAQTKDFEEYIDLLYKEWSHVKNLLHFRPQVSFVKPVREHINYLGRFETLAEDTNYIGDEIGIRLSLPYENPSKGRKADYREYYNGRTKAIIAELYAGDITYFNYDFNTGSGQS